MHWEKKKKQCYFYTLRGFHQKSNFTARPLIHRSQKNLFHQTLHMSSQVMHKLLTACFASFGELANQSIFLSVLRAEEWATDAPVIGFLWEMDWGSAATLQSSTGPVAQSGPQC